MRPQKFFRCFAAALAALFLSACAATPPSIPVDRSSVAAGSSVTRGGTTTLHLLGQPLQVGQPLPAVTVVDTHLQPVDLASLRGEVLVLSIVPSLDTKVCERQTHLLGEAKLPAGIRRITVSRDLPFAQQRFAQETGFPDILFLSDYQQAAFGKATGLLVDKIYLLARAVAVVDRKGIVRYLQVVPELSHLPDMEEAFTVARRLQLE
jgi:thioredoxin-dependent peroxiredoxin